MKQLDKGHATTYDFRYRLQPVVSGGGTTSSQNAASEYLLVGPFGSVFIEDLSARV